MFNHVSWNLKFLLHPGLNDAGGYGVSVEAVPGAAWRCIGVHHLSGPENTGNHNVYVDVLDAKGKRVPGAGVVVHRPGQPDLFATVDKPANEPGTNFPLWSKDNVSLGVAGGVSDVVHGLRSSHPDEEPGNTLFHHSFYVVFQPGADIPGPEPPEPSPGEFPGRQAAIDALYAALTSSDEARAAIRAGLAALGEQAETEGVVTYDFRVVAMTAGALAHTMGRLEEAIVDHARRREQELGLVAGKGVGSVPGRVGREGDGKE